MQSQNHLLRYCVLLPAALIITASLTGGCHKKVTPTVVVPVDTTDSVAVYTQLKPGNYWIYETYVVDTNGNGRPGSNGYDSSAPPRFDSVYVEKDTVIAGYTWHKLMNFELLASPDEPTYLRDSSQYLLSLYGRYPQFAVNDFSRILYQYDSYDVVGLGDSAIHHEVQMTDKNLIVTVPAGAYATRALQFTYIFYPYPMYMQPPFTRRLYTRYAAGIGMVTETLPLYISDPFYLERRLVRYHLN